MHPCLNVDEIIRLIAFELVTSQAKATAVSFACNSKNFEDPVLDTLWETQDELLPLLKSLPIDIWLGRTKCTSFKRLPTMLEWARFRKYARRMRRLEDCGNLRDLSSEALSVMQFCTIKEPKEPLFPNLETLELSDATGQFLPFIHLFLSPRTTTINITFDEYDSSEPIIASMVTAFPTLCPSLEVICLRSLPSDPISKSWKILY